ncbi:MAG: chemotaxis protein CheB [Bacteroidales bacterium]|nr:chemotaxis protein CheB [Bacteroidales bacterium]MCF8403671.1 chemotaxis protein CheB [Bacteroidales bacterium]
MTKNKIRAVVVGVSAGGLTALKKFLPALPPDFPVPIIIVQHIYPHSDNYFIHQLNDLSKITVKEAEEKEKACPAVAYIAPPNYHLLMENDVTISFSTEARVNYSRPSIDVLFETAAFVFGPDLIGIILTGANFDGSTGLKKIKSRGGITIVQDPKTAEVNYMPQAAIDICEPDYVLPLEDIAQKILDLCS